MAATSGLDNEFMQLREEADTADLRKQLIQEERQKYLLGEGKPFSWDEVKEMAVNKGKRNGL